MTTGASASSTSIETVGTTTAMLMSEFGSKKSLPAALP